MKKIIFIIIISVFFSVSNVNVQAATTKIVSGQLFVGGTSYNTNDYQTFLAFSLIGKRKNPTVDYTFFGQQILSVYQNHPINPDGYYEFSVKMPYTPDGIIINGTVSQPVWYSDCFWDIQANVQTPIASKDSSQFVNAQGPFRLNGRIYLYGAVSVSTRIIGFGIADLKFEKIEGRYYLLEATYEFGVEENSKQ